MKRNWKGLAVLDKEGGDPQNIAQVTSGGDCFCYLRYEVNMN